MLRWMKALASDVGLRFIVRSLRAWKEKALVQRKNEISFTPHKTSFSLEFFFLCIGNCTKENLDF